MSGFGEAEKFRGDREVTKRESGSERSLCVALGALFVGSKRLRDSGYRPVPVTVTGCEM